MGMKVDSIIRLSIKLPKRIKTSYHSNTAIRVVSKSGCFCSPKAISRCYNIYIIIIIIIHLKDGIMRRETVTRLFD
jgi:hypothetical protein